MKRALLIILAIAVVISITFGTYGLFKGSFFVDKRLVAFKEQSAKSLSKNKYKEINCDVLVIGGGAGGSAAAIQSARSGSKTCVIEETDWLGGMMTSAGVASLDGHDWNYTGILKEINDGIEAYYADTPDENHKCLSPFCYEPHVGAEVLAAMAKKEKNLTVYFNTTLTGALKNGNRIIGATAKTAKGQDLKFNAKITIEASEWGDFLYLADVPFDLGPDANSKEPDAASQGDCLQPLTYVGIIRDTGAKVAPVEKPADYDPKQYECFIANKLCKKSTTQFVNFQYFRSYGEFPFGKIMVNVPSHSWGNDFNHAAQEYDALERSEINDKAKSYTLGLIYFIQTALGKNTYELVKDEFGTADGLAKIPYGRESRRAKGIVRLTENDILPDALTGVGRFWPDAIAVGDYFIDLHRCSPGAPDIFTKVPPFQIPYRALVPAKIDGLILAEKNISVSHLANGASRLQPIVVNLGQAAGFAAAIAVKSGKEPRDIDVSELQKQIIENKSRVNFYSDVDTSHFAFEPVSVLTQKGVVKGYPNQLFGFTNTLNRADFAAMLIKNFGASENSIKKSEFKFKDIEEAAWYETYAYGLPVELSAFFKNNRFEALKPISRGEAANWIAQFVKLDSRAGNDKPISFDDLSTNYKYKTDIELLAKLEIMKGANGKIRPNAPMSRAEITTVLYRTSNALN